MEVARGLTRNFLVVVLNVYLTCLWAFLFHGYSFSRLSRFHEEPNTPVEVYGDAVDSDFHGNWQPTRKYAGEFTWKRLFEVPRRKFIQRASIYFPWKAIRYFVPNLAEVRGIVTESVGARRFSTNLSVSVACTQSQPRSQLSGGAQKPPLT